MTDDSNGLSRRKILGGLGVMGGAGLIGGATTTSLLWDEEKFGNESDPNVLQGGELDLGVDWEVRYYDWIDSTDELIAISDTNEDGEPDMVDQPGPIIDLTDVKPGDVMEATLSAHVYGNPAFLGWHYQEHADEDNGITEPEDKVNGHTPDQSDGDPYAAGLGLGAAGLLGDALRRRLQDEEDDSTLSARQVFKGAALGAAGLVGLGAATGSAAAASPTVTDTLAGTLTPQDLADTLVSGAGDITVTNVTYQGANQSAGTFTDGADAIGIDEGIILSSGYAFDVEGPNDEDDLSVDSVSSEPTDDPDLASLSSFELYDQSVLEIEFEVPSDKDQVFFSYVFGSEEYNEFVGSNFEDVFGFFVNGTNVATVDDPTDGTQPVTINSINSGENSDLYIDNTDGSLDTQMDGLTVVLNVSGQVNPGETNTLKLAIADASDNVLDSWVLIEGDSFSTVPPAEQSGDGELDDVMNCVIWYDDGDNIPGEIWTGETELPDGTEDSPDDELDDATKEDYVMEIGMAQQPSDIVDTDAAVFAGTVAEMDGTDVLFNAQDSLAGSVATDFQGTYCYQNSDTEYIGVLCWVPTDIPGVNDNVIQTDRLAFQFGFDAIQCRHNVGNDGAPMAGTLGEADAENNAQSPGGDTPTPE